MSVTQLKENEIVFLSAVPGQTDSVPSLLQHYGETGLEAQIIAAISENYSITKWLLDYLDSE